MPNKIKPKRSYATGAVPTTSDLDVNEIAISWADNKLFTKNSAGNIVSVTLGGSGSASIVAAATAAGFPATGVSSSTLYISTDASRVYRFDSSGVYIEIGTAGGGMSSTVTLASSQVTGLAAVATSGNYNDLTNNPSIPSISGLVSSSSITAISVVTQ
jgi:hypothetical protein